MESKRAALPWLLLVAVLGLGFVAPRVSQVILGAPGPTTSTFYNPSQAALGALPLGTLTSASNTSVTNSTTTGNTFTLVGDQMVDVQCSSATCVGPGSTCSCTLGNANQCPLVQANVEKLIYIPAGITSMAAIAVSGNDACAVYSVLR